ncbi:cytochrome b/b6 domain-containing protein [uncultured Thiohalocapsa sp.]|uniref:cytochrome b/b6 domain-containing protein n=1 Tax=uncultured Thiohalocapsa sp. TaxID=768990 RepID=UPI0025DF8987|nr:cytochrome b/b6 domain-containing protein [uncultured Thiohalocapsa sp.]
MRIKVWDLPTRLFHWLLFAGVTGALLTGWIGGGWIEWHGRLGLFVLGLLTFRLVWGLLGSTYARFAQFAPTPGRVIAYLRGRWQGEGHNPLGALSVFALLGMLTWQALSGLFSNDDIAFEGPLADLVSSATSTWLSGLHRQGLWIILGLVALHLTAIAVYAVRGKHLVKPMVVGWKESQDAAAKSARGGKLWSLILGLAVAAGVVWIAAGGLLPPPPPPPPVPAW